MAANKFQLLLKTKFTRKFNENYSFKIILKLYIYIFNEDREKLPFYVMILVISLTVLLSFFIS